MNTFQIITVVISGLGLLGAIIAVYVKTQIDIAKIQTGIMFLQRDLDTKEVSILRVEKCNREDHDKIISKIDNLIDKYNGK